MNPMNFGEEMKFHQQRNLMRGNWIPETPGKQINTSHPKNQFPAEEWQQLSGMYGAILQEPANLNGGTQNFNPTGPIQNVGCYSSNGDLAERNRLLNNIAGSFAQANITPWNNSTLAEPMEARNLASMAQMNRLHRGTVMANTPIRGTNMVQTQPIPDLLSQADGSWRRPYPSALALANVKEWLTSNQLGTCNSLSQRPQDGFPVPYGPNDNLNLLPRADTDATTSLGNSAQIPAIPQNKASQLESSQFSAIFNSLIEECSSKGKELENFVATVEDEAIQNPCNELQNIVDSSSTLISEPLEENNDLEKASDQDIDLYKTPQQKAPKRKKIRPKVVKEGKPKSVPKSAGQNMDSKENQKTKRKYVRKTALPTLINTVSKQNTTGKRKYVRKKGVTEPATTQQANSSSTGDPNAGSTAKSCRRGLNFDLEKSCDGDQGRISGQVKAQSNIRSSNLNLDTPVAELCDGTNSLGGKRSAGQINGQDGTTGTHNLASSMDDMLARYRSLQGRRAAGAPQASMNGLHRENLNVSSEDIDVRNVDPWQKRSKSDYTPRQHTYAEGVGQLFFPVKTREENIDTARQLMSQRRAQQLLNTFPHSTEARSKRKYQQMVQQEECYKNSSNFGIDISENHKKRKFDSGPLMSVHGMPFVKAVEDVPREANTRCTNEIGTNSFAPHVSHEILNSYFKNGRSPNKPSGVKHFPGDLHPHPVAAEQTFPLQHSPQSHSDTDRTGKTKGVTKVQNLASLTTIIFNPYTSAPPRKDSAPRKGWVNRAHQATTPASLQQIGSFYKQSPMQSNGLAEQQQCSNQIDEIIKRLGGLSLNDDASTMVGQEQKAIVIYKGDGAIVVHDAKKRKLRPKVDLDPETNRIWKLLMGNEGSVGIEGTDKEKWWEGEREVFRGRADSFIARMHLIQGDRRFSPWKGSVVDSVIGVFLTQNVSDHLSSSAFMCLAARFPPHSTSNEAYESNGKSILVEEPEDRAVNTEQRRNSKASPTERTSFTEMKSQSIEEEVISSQGSYDSSVVQDNGGISSSPGSNSEAEDPRNGCTYNRSHDSNSTKFQEMEKTTIFHECCSHTSECSILDERSSCQSKQLEHMEGGRIRSMLHVSYLKDSVSTCPITSQDPQMRVPVSPSNSCLSHMTPEFGLQEYIDMFNEKSTSPGSSASSGFITGKDPNCISNMSDSNIHHNGPLRSQGMQTMDPFELSSSHPMQQNISQSQPHAACDQLLRNNYPSGRKKSCQLENTSVAGPVKHPESQPNWKDNDMQSVLGVSKQMKNTSVESTPVIRRQENRQNKLVKPKEQVHYSDKASNETNNKAKKRKAENEDKNAVDWDHLRKEAQANGRKERSKNVMDTMDYEAMRCANVHEISNPIKERGMSNMLAERIKDFLNRLVREHGSIDLEWLRDVPPDKAKEYLLSIRGLGLKSVECIRLLTLHQLAFPVDTNVGRIAVRLGWVPLQPLPESLQLHLLEMYPMLESVQKYLWPRLCKLDQRTLYELHYQMITFGKVFCTKSKPNCNACPMKGECRHFASAYASARLALPGPEENSIVSSTFPSAQENPTAFINPMLLLKEAGRDNGKSNPIIEEPATPEQESTELPETDIEDMFDEDPDEIPTINLNMETFTENLEKYMKDNMELQEGDMSKALVALNPEAAAIPTPKLKNVSRLRTEHQVYELPDLHPLLSKMERREPDDPSPYLLVIWTPGETADSVQPPEIKCSFQDTGKLCNDKTCFSCNSTRESNSQTVRGTILIPCRTAMRGSFPLNGTYFQVNEMFADHDSSVNPIDVPRAWIWNLPRRTVYFGTSVSTIFKGLSTERIQYCFWRGFVCVRGFDQKARAPRPLSPRLHYSASRLTKQ